MADISVVRTEKKYSITWIRQSELLSRLAPVMRVDPNSRTGSYTVRSLYFDSIYDNDYFDKVNGLELRKKIRLRIYLPGETGGQPGTVKLELKQKQGSAQKKESFLISRALAEEMIQGNYAGLDRMDSEQPEALYRILVMGVYRPRCIVEYRRIAFSEEIAHTRITFDSDIGASHACERFFERELALLPVRNQPVLEVKYNGFLLSPIKQALDFADAPELAVSKYAMARQLFGM